MDIVQVNADRRVRLRVYLNDHLAGAMGALRLVERARGNNGGTLLGDFLAELQVQVEEDYRTLRGLLDALGMHAAVPKQGLAVAAEWVGRWKLNGQLRGYSPLARLVELEALSAGVQAKGKLWLSLQELVDVEPAVARIDLSRMIERAERQHEQLEGHRRKAAQQALAVD